MYEFWLRRGKIFQRHLYHHTLEKEATPYNRSGDLAEVTMYCRKLAGQHAIISGYPPAGLLNKLSKIEKKFLPDMRMSGSGIEKDRAISEILQLVQEHMLIFQNQINKIAISLSAMSTDLPQLVESLTLKRLRVHDLCDQIVICTDAKIDPENLIEYVTAYQDVSVLRYDELKAIKVFLLFSILDQLSGILQKNAFGENEIRRSKVIVRNSICSISVIDAMDWQDFLDNNSCIDHILRQNTAGIYSNMDFFTRDRYRNEISKLAEQAGVTERDVAGSILLLSRRSAPLSARVEGLDTGEFLIGGERQRLEKFLGIQFPFREKFRKICRQSSLSLYLTSIGLLTVSATLFCVYLLGIDEISAYFFWPGCLLLAIGLSHTAKQFVDAMVSVFNVSKSLPTLDFSKKIPLEYTTLVTIPAIITDEREIEQLVHQLKIYFIGNKIDNLYFSLLTDFCDATTEKLPRDAELIRYITSKITNLNNEFCTADSPRFFLFHRPRKWNAADKTWMGYERKRGKLMDLNNFLRNPGNGSFNELIADKTILPRIKYVITLDADTQLPRDSAWRLIAAMSHPLNRAVYSEEKKRIIAGYGMLQPKMGTDLRGINNSLYESMCGFGPDIDPYTSASADVYQDLFNEGSFMGKGIYDVDIVNKVLTDRLPENQILSHDLLEGSYVRTGFLSNIKLHEQAVNYWVETRRRERWTRGDWQIASWAFFSVPGFRRKRTKNPLSALSRWKIFDNLRNSLVSVSLLLLVVFGLLIFKEPLRLSLVILLIALSPGFCLFLSKLLKKPKKLIRKAHWKSSLNDSYNRFFQDFYVFICLPYEAAYTISAVLRACWRLVFSGRKLLEWRVSKGTEKHDPNTLFKTYRQMWVSPFIGGIVLITLIISYSGLVFSALPVLLLWLAAPLFVYVINRPRTKTETVLSSEQQELIHRLSRKTWAYFNDQITEAVNWLPPDHVQEYPKRKVACYTSPTNMGLALLSYLTAFDLGYLSAGDLIERVRRTLHTMQSLERYKGHFYNWYDIKTLNATIPRYVSTVDSGNLAGHLITLRQGLSEIRQQPILSSHQFSSLIEVLNMVILPGDTSTLLQDCKNYLLRTNEILPHSTEDTRLIIGQLDIYAAAITNLIDGTAISDFRKYWLDTFVLQLQSIVQDLQVVAPWLWLVPCPSTMGHLMLHQIPSLEALANWQSPVTVINENRELLKEEAEWLEAFYTCMGNAKSAACNRLQQLNSLVSLCTELAEQEYDFLYKPSAYMLSIGYKVEEDCLDTECYDMLASEARLATYVGICQNKLPQKSWFSLGRPLISKNSKSVLLSANGTMFEYLMPNLVMPVFGKTILDYACSSAVSEQIRYAKEQGIPWGTSESCYGLFDDDLNYQYRVFGIPPLSLKHQHVIGDQVISPYATALALLVDPGKAGDNLEILSAAGVEGRYGLYEAVDYTSSRLEKGKSSNIIRSFMVHHQGMSFLAFAHVLLNKRMQQRFIADAEMESGVFLLQEKLPDSPVFHNQKPATSVSREPTNKEDSLISVSMSSDLSIPEVQLLSTGRYHIVLDNSEDCHSCFRFIIEEEEGRSHEIFFQDGHTTFKQYANEVQAEIKITVSHDDHMEVRQLILKNTSDKSKHVEIIAELPSKKESWQKEDLPEESLILYYKKQEIFCDEYTCHFLSLHIADMEAEADKVFATHTLSIRYDLQISPGETITVLMSAGIAGSREQAFERSQLVKNSVYTEQLFRQSELLGLEQLKQIGISKDEACLFRQLTGALLIGEEARIMAGDIQFERLATSEKDLIILLSVSKVENIEAVVKLVQLHWYWRLNGLSVTVLILNEDQGCYKNFLQKLIIETITNSIGSESLNRHGGGIFTKMPDHLTPEDQILLKSAGYMLLVEEEEIQ